MNFDIASNYKMIQLNGTLALDEIQGRTDKINAFIKYYKNMEIPLKKDKRKRNEFVECYCTERVALVPYI
ncbi:hypothetical protein H8356DRAFT_1362155 [Neocallimastix lanati (nom. inval.)]|nr:hypothetical protein H8356DRAFT_1362155 [Neocallimastix sp. JGI-2020a]